MEVQLTRMLACEHFGGVISWQFALYLASRSCSASAMTLPRAAVAWHVFALSHSGFHLGLIGLVQFVPLVSLALFGGAVADTFDRRRVMLMAQSAPLLGAVLLCWVSWADRACLII